ncbi:ABC-2 type transport system permease protein [Paenibacillus uliginis N3/975]|uniref:ABC-2 type transport system permease protein n=1 Tax=Paenibacillus uliginis N3/975 TaxID=1313296 RepID=A0A1X7G4R0_9BACL|nr:ABC-2 type transport system permease protein [Paenibacillus uliginis N3/975]
MTNIWRLTKIQLLSSFGLNKALHTRDVKERRKLLLLSIGILIGVIMIAVASFGYSFMMALTFEQIGRMDLLLAIMMAVTSIVGFFTTIYKASGVLFSFKDFDLVMSLPIKTSHVVASRVLQLYVLNLFFTLMVMLPAGAVYAIKVSPEALYYLFFLIALLFIPLLPIIAATVIGALISWISSRFKASRMISLILTFGVIIGVMIGSFRINGNEQVLADMSTQLADMIFKLYPLAAMYVDAVCSYKIGSLLLFIAISVLAFMLFTTVLGTRYKAIHTGLTTSHASSKYIMKPLETSSPFRALYKKELRRYIGSSLYVLNTSIGMIFLLVMSIALLFMSSEKLGQLIEIPQLSDYLSKLAPLVVSLFVILSCTTSSSISLEGNNLWILKSSPVPKKTILLSKVAVNLTITMPISIVSCVMLMISLRTGWIESLLLLVIPLIYACYSAMLGVIVNLKLPNLEWISEVTVIKQSASVLVSMLIGFISLVIPFAISLLLSHVNGNLISLGIGIMMMVVCGVMYRYIQTKGEQLFQAL